MVLRATEKPIYKTYEDYPIEDLLLYAGIDCLVTSELASKLVPACVRRPEFHFSTKGNKSKQGTEVREIGSILDSYEKYMAPAFEFIIDLEINGFKYDIEKNREINNQMVAEMKLLEEKVKPYTGDINFDSGVELGKLLYEVKQFEPPFMTKSGEPATDGDALKELAKSTGQEWLEWLAKRNDIASTWRTFIRTYVEDFVKSDGRIHPSYNLHGTSSFRISGENPNLTQLPRPKHGYNIRQCFTVDSGYLFLALDFSSAEVKVLGALSKDPNILKAIEEGLDFHSFSASKMHGIPYEEFVAVLEDDNHPLKKKYKGMRQDAKALTFGILYGSTAGGVANSMGISYAEAEKLISLYFNAYPRVREYIENAHNMATWNNFVVTHFGQRKMQYGTMPVFKGTAVYNGALRNSQNVLVQSTTSTLGLFCFAKVNEAIKPYGARCLATVYDSLEIEVPIEHAAEVLELAFYYMNDYPVEVFDWLDLPIGAEAEIGFNWGDAKVVHRGATQEDILKLCQIG